MLAFMIFCANTLTVDEGYTMQQDYHYPATEKILSDIENIIRRDSKLKGFEIVPVTRNENKSPIHYQEHCLGLEKWCIPHVYSHSYNHIMSLRRNRKREEPGQVCRLLMGALMINPEITSFWNMRKDYITRSKIDINFELNLTSLILCKKPKCDEVFNHRKWIVKRMLKDFQSDISLLTDEISICEAAAERYSNNYHAWTHRIWCLNQIGSTHWNKVYLNEWILTEKWISTHVSDYSGFHYRSYLINLIIDHNVCNEIETNLEPSYNQFTQTINSLGGGLIVNLRTPYKFFIYELLLSSDLIETYPGHETLWCHRRNVFQLLKNIMTMNKSYQNIEEIPLKKEIKFDSYSNTDSFIKSLKLYEKLFLNKIHKYNDSRQIRYLEKYVEWVEKVLKFNINV